MTMLAWNDKYRCGVAAIDHEHRELIEAINDLLARMNDNGTDDEVAFFLGEIHSQIESHFALEEKMMRDTGYANYGPHKTDHDRLLDDIRDIMDDVHAGEAGARDPLAARLHAWFSDHFRTMDKDLHTMTAPS